MPRYLHVMTDEIRILYNDTCPVCRFEIDGYRALAERRSLPLGFDTLDRAESWGLTRDAAARRLHVRTGDGAVLSGMAAFRAIWARLPHLRWAARVTGWPLLRQAFAFGYDRIAAPLLYRAHLRRQRRK